MSYHLRNPARIESDTRCAARHGLYDSIRQIVLKRRCHIQIGGIIYIDKLSLVIDIAKAIYRKRKTLRSLTERAALTEGHCVTDIPNAIDTEVFCPGDKAEARLRLKLPADRHMLLFGSMKTTDKRKGIDYLIEASLLLAEKYPELADTLGVMVLGAASAHISCMVHTTGFPEPSMARSPSSDSMP